MSFSAEIGWAVMDELAQFHGCDIREIVQVETVYCDIVDCIIDVIEDKLRGRVEQINELLLDRDSAI